jgi:hypothetical protein
MALDEVVKYKIELDQEDLGAQLDNVRQQIDLAMGRGAAFAVPPPSLSNFMSGTGGFQATDAMQTFQNGVGGAMEMMDRMAESAQLGFNKFTGDMRRVGLMQPTDYPDFTAPLSRLDANLPQGFFGRVGAATLGLGYDPRGPLSRGAYGGAVRESLGEDIGDFFAENALTIMGTAAFGLVGGGFGMAADVGLSFLTGRVSDRNEIFEGIQNLADLSIGGISRKAGLALATDLEAYTTSFQGQLNDVTRQDIQEVLSVFSNAGGFQGMQGTQDFTQTVKGVVENVRTVAHALGVFQEEAAAIMGGLQQKGITTMGGIGGFAISQQAMGTSVGMSGLDFMQFGMRGAEMVMGTGLGAATGFEMAQSALMTTDALMMANPVSNFMVRDLGGREAASMNMAETVLRYNQSAIGQLDVYNYMGGGGLGGTFQERFTGAANFLSTPENYFTALMARGPQSAAIQEQRGFFGGTMSMVNTMADQLRAMGIDPTQGNVGGFMVSQGIADPAQAQLLLTMSSLGRAGMLEISGEAGIRTMEGIVEENSASVIAKGLAFVESAFSGLGFDPAGIGYKQRVKEAFRGINREVYNIEGSLREGGEPIDLAAIRASIAEKRPSGFVEPAKYGEKTGMLISGTPYTAATLRESSVPLTEEEQAIFTATEALRVSPGGQMLLAQAKTMGWKETSINELRDRLTIEIAEKGSLVMPEDEEVAELALEGYKSAKERFFGTKGEIDYSKISGVSSTEAMKAYRELEGKDREAFGRVVQEMYGTSEKTTATAIKYIADRMKDNQGAMPTKEIK